MSDIEKKIEELEKRIEKLERDEKPYDPSGKINPYDLSEVVKIRRGQK